MADNVLGVILAAGAGIRFGGPKALATTEGERWVDRAVRVLHQGGIEQVDVVSGAWDDLVPGAEVFHNPDWKSGIAGSAALAVALAEERRADTLLITLVDLPDLTPDHVAAVLSAPGDLVQASYDGRPGHPVKVGRRHFAGLRAFLLEHGGDSGARTYLVEHGVIELPLAGSLTDVDQPPLP